MADSIQFPRGKKETMPTLPPGAPGWCMDEKALYIGHPDGNQKVGSAELFTQVSDLEKEQKSQRENISSLGEAQKTQGEAITNLTEAQKKQAEELTNKLTARAVEGQDALSDTAELAAVIRAFNALVAAMKTSKVMGE